jgi:hypothetical protein
MDDGGPITEDSMLGKAFTFEKVRDALEEHFELRSVIAGTLTAQAFRAAEVESGQEVTVWRTRGPLVKSEINRFADRLGQLVGIQGVQPILRAGIDSHNIGFAVLPQYDSKKIDSRAGDMKELENRFNACVRIIESLHERSLVCGDLCLDSFVANDRGKVSLFAVLGDVRLENEDEEFNRARYLAFRPPEQALGGVQSPGCDLYALGWIGDGLFACDVDEEGHKKAPPTWLKNILNATATAELRAGELTAKKLRAVIERHDSGAESVSGDEFALVEVASGAASHSDGYGGERGGQERKAFSVDDKHPDEDDREGESRGSSKRNAEGFDKSEHGAVPEGRARVVQGLSSLFSTSGRVPLLAIANIVALGVLFLSFVEVKTLTRRVDTDGSVAINRRAGIQESLQTLYASDDPVGHKNLVKTLNEEVSPEVREEIFLALVSRSRRMGFTRAAEVVRGRYNASQERQQFGSVGSSGLMVAVIDPALSKESQVDELTKLYEFDPGVATLLAAALALDSGDAEPYRGILARAVADQVGVPDGGEHSPYALMLLLPDAHDLFSEDLIEESDKIPSADIKWLLEVLGRKGRSEIATVAQLASNRQVVAGPYAVFLRELQMSVTLSEGLRMSLVSGMLGTLSSTDIKRFGEWYGQGAPRVLEASIITAQDSGIRSAAFDALRTKPLSDTYIAQIVEFLDSTYGGESSKYGGIVAVFALRETVDAQTVNRELGLIKNAPRMRDLLKQLVKGAPPDMLVVLLQRYSDSMEPLDVVDLLSNPSVEVRKVAVDRLSSENDIMLLKLISQSYDDEKDPSVRAVYEAKIGVVRDRGRPAL